MDKVAAPGTPPFAGDLRSRRRPYGLGLEFATRLSSERRGEKRVKGRVGRGEAGVVVLALILARLSGKQEVAWRGGASSPAFWQEEEERKKEKQFSKKNPVLFCNCYNL